jgi:hypothetical protein
MNHLHICRINIWPIPQRFQNSPIVSSQRCGTTERRSRCLFERAINLCQADIEVFAMKQVVRSLDDASLAQSKNQRKPVGHPAGEGDRRSTRHFLSVK